MSEPQTVVILSRGIRLAPLYRAVALDLARDYRVVVLMYNSDEHEIWRGAEGIVCVDLAAEMAREAGRFGSKLAERTREIERETNLPLYKAASNYLLYRRFAKEYHGGYPPLYTSERGVMEEYVGAYGVLSRIFDEYKPILVLHEAIDLVTTFVALAAAYRRRILNIGWIYAPSTKEGSIMFYYGLRRQNFVCSYLMRNPQLIAPDSRGKARTMIAKVRAEGPPLLSHVETRRSQISRPSQFLKRSFRNGGWRHPLLVLERWVNWIWLSRHLRHDIPEQPYILFLMHVQPEASTASQLPRWVDQERVIEQMAVNAPQGMRIVVKENPQCYGWRGKRYFGALADLANVHLCHPGVSTHELIRRAAALVTLTGSAGMEAILFGTRVAALGRPFYSEYPGVRRLEAPEQIFTELADPSWQREQYESELETFVAAYLQSVHELGDVESGRKWPAVDVMGPRFAQAVRRTLEFINPHGLSPGDFEPGYPLASAVTASSPPSYERAGA